MIPEAREVRLKPKIRKVLEARCRAASTPQRDIKRARIVLLAAEGWSTRSIAKEVGVHQQRIYDRATNKRILALLEKPPPQGYGRWTGPLLAKALGTSTFN